MIQPYLDLKAKQARIEDLKCEDGGYCQADVVITLNDLEYMVADMVGYWNDLSPDQQKRVQAMAENIFRQIALGALTDTCISCGRDNEDVCNHCRVGNTMPVINESAPLKMYLETIFSN